MSQRDADGISNLEYHVLLAMAEGPRYGYAIKTAVEGESSGALQPRAGSLYRVLARLISAGWVTETEAPEPDEPHPGRARKYYGLTEPGREALANEARRLRDVAALAEDRLGIADGGR
ncbi:MAG: PadR family transcriptional regulator [Acidobacteria bacterium]|nr:PadR family transcriptional regulator [Acidobacteriota bacterium]